MDSPRYYRLTEWEDAEKAVKHWLTMRESATSAPAEIAKERETAANLVYAALLSDAICLAFKITDTKLPGSLRRNREEMKQLSEFAVSSVFATRRFTSIMVGHNEEKGAKLRTWLNIRLRSRLIDRLRKEQRQHMHELSLPFSEEDWAEVNQGNGSDEMAMSPEEIAITNQELKNLQDIFSKVLTERQQKIILCDIDVETNEEGSHELGISLATYKREKRAAKEKLKEAKLRE